MARRALVGGPKRRPAHYTSGASRESVRLAQAFRAHKRGDLAGAVVCYREVLETDPESVDAWANLGSAYARLGLARGAEAAFACALERAPHDARLLRDAGVGLAAVGELEAGSAYLTRALTLAPALVGARLHLARIAGELGDDEAAIAHARAALEHAPNEAAPHLELARASFRDDDPSASMEPARRATELDPSDAVARLFHAGLLALVDGEHAESAPRLRPRAGEQPDGAIDGLAYVLAARRHALGAAASLRLFPTRRATLEDACRRVSLPGPFVELGVRHGVSARALAGNSARNLIGFDSFEGLPTEWHDRPRGAFTTGGELPRVPPNVELVVGLFDQTLSTRPTLAPSLIHVDCDLYESARTAFSFLAPRIAPGCIIVFDEYVGHRGWQNDEHRAFREACSEHQLRYRYLAFGWFTGQAMLEITGRGCP